jgi:hypothetical protein
MCWSLEKTLHNETRKISARENIIKYVPVSVLVSPSKKSPAYKSKRLFAKCKIIAGKTERQTTVKNASISPAKKLVINPSKEKWANAKNTAEINIALESP